MSALDRLLCERLGIEPRPWTCKCGHDRDDHLLPPLTATVMCRGEVFHQCRCTGFVEASADYPALSTTGDGMWLLMETLRLGGWDPNITAWSKAPHHFVDRKHWYVAVQDPISGGLTSRHHASAPMALALAAAAALGVEVPE